MRSSSESTSLAWGGLTPMRCTISSSSVGLGYPSPTEELEIVHRMGVNPPHANEVLSLEDLIRAQEATKAVYVDHGVVDYAVSLVLATRNPGAYNLPELDELVSYGGSPRASLALVAGARA